VLFHSFWASQRDMKAPSKIHGAVRGLAGIGRQKLAREDAGAPRNQFATAAFFEPF
jgi:hypothetical protein